MRRVDVFVKDLFTFMSFRLISKQGKTSNAVGILITTKEASALGMF